MPGVLNFNSQCGFTRVGKMAFLMHPDTTFSSILNDHRDLIDSFLESSSPFVIENADSDCDLPDNEHPVDLIEFLDNPDPDLEHQLHQNKCAEGCNNCASKYSTPVSSRQDPFMGMVSTESVRSSTSICLEQLVGTTDYDSGSDEALRQKVWDTKIFSAWNAPKLEDEPDFSVPKSSVGWQGLFEEDTFPETPSPSSAQSGTNTGDDSDVDIETITDAPRTADSCGYVTQDSCTSISPSASPGPFWNGGFSVTMDKSSIGFSPNRKPMSASLKMKSNTIQNSLMSESASSRSNILGQKRKLSKDRKLASRSQSQPVYSHVLCNSNSVNFHDYAMSPGAYTYPSSTETGRPTVLSKRTYKRFTTVDASGKEKQHHHNQLERNRRQKLADLFVDLRDEVPKIANQAKASKVLILNEATVYIHELQKVDKQQEDDISKEQRRKDILRRQLRHLQAQMSIQCVK